MAISKIRLLKAISRRTDNTIIKSTTKQKQTNKANKTKQTKKKNKKRQTIIHKTENERKLTCSRIDIAEII
jgi:hypothetical protein